MEIVVFILIAVFGAAGVLAAKFYGMFEDPFKKTEDPYQTPIIVEPMPPETLPEEQNQPVEETPAPNPTTPLYQWDTPQNTRHSVRVICDEEGLTVYEKNVITACIQQESQFNNAAVCRNRDRNGKVWSSDWGICQINDYWHIGIGKTFPSVDFVLNNPDEVVRWMIEMYRKGQLKQWVSFSSGAYKKWMPK